MMDAAAPDDLNDRIAALYAHEPSEFVAAREREAKALRALKRREDAATVHRLSRPSLVAWAAGRVVAEQRPLFDSLCDAGRALLEAQTAALERGDAAALRAALVSRRQAVWELVDATVAFLRGRDGAASVSRDELAVLFEAVSVDAEHAAALARGVLVRTPAPPSGFELLGEVTLAPARPPRSTAGRAGRAVAAVEAPASERIDVEPLPGPPPSGSVGGADRADVDRADVDPADADPDGSVGRGAPDELDGSDGSAAERRRERARAERAAQVASAALREAAEARRAAIESQQRAEAALAEAVRVAAVATDEVRVLEERLVQARSRAAERDGIAARARLAAQVAAETAAAAERAHRSAADTAARLGITEG